MGIGFLFKEGLIGLYKLCQHGWRKSVWYIACLAPHFQFLFMYAPRVTANCSHFHKLVTSSSECVSKRGKSNALYFPSIAFSTCFGFNREQNAFQVASDVAGYLLAALWVYGLVHLDNG